MQQLIFFLFLNGLLHDGHTWKTLPPLSKMSMQLKCSEEHLINFWSIYISSQRELLLPEANSILEE